MTLSRRNVLIIHCVSKVAIAAVLRVEIQAILGTLGRTTSEDPPRLFALFDFHIAARQTGGSAIGPLSGVNPRGKDGGCDGGGVRERLPLADPLAVPL